MLLASAFLLVNEVQRFACPKDDLPEPSVLTVCQVAERAPFAFGVTWRAAYLPPPAAQAIIVYPAGASGDEHWLMDVLGYAPDRWDWSATEASVVEVTFAIDRGVADELRDLLSDERLAILQREANAPGQDICLDGSAVTVGHAFDGQIADAWRHVCDAPNTIDMIAQAFLESAVEIAPSDVQPLGPYLRGFEYGGEPSGP